MLWTITADNVLPAVCCSSFAWPAPGCPVPDPAQEGYCWPGGASGWGKAEMVMGRRHLTKHHPGAEGKGLLTNREKIQMLVPTKCY